MSESIPLLPCAGGMANVPDASHAMYQPRRTAAGWQTPERLRAAVNVDIGSDSVYSLALPPTGSAQ